MYNYYFISNYYFSFCIFKIKNLELNWKTGHCNKKIVSLGDSEENVQFITDVISMNSKSIAVGCPLGIVKMFNRKDLSRKKVIGLMCLLSFENIRNRAIANITRFAFIRTSTTEKNCGTSSLKRLFNQRLSFKRLSLGQGHQPVGKTEKLRLLLLYFFICVCPN